MKNLNPEPQVFRLPHCESCGSLWPEHLRECSLDPRRFEPRICRKWLCKAGIGAVLAVGFYGWLFAELVFR